MMRLERKANTSSQVEPSFTGPYITNIYNPLLIWPICSKVTIQQIWRNVELMFTICFDLMFTRSNN